MVPVFTALVLIPVLVARFPYEIALWHVAAAENDLERQAVSRAEQRLADAMRWDPSVEDSAEYITARVHWLARQERVIEAMDLLTSRLSSDDAASFRTAALSISEYFVSDGNFLQALAALRIGMKETTTPTWLNQRAYIRALANVELNEALKDIDEVLTTFGDEPDAAILDTRAWVLYRLEKGEEARKVMDMAFEKKIRDLEQLGAFLGYDQDPQDETDRQHLAQIRDQITRLHQIEDRVERYTKVSRTSLGILATYHYHRKMIRLACNDPTASEDEAWLKRHGFVDESLLY